MSFFYCFVDIVICLFIDYLYSSLIIRVLEKLSQTIVTFTYSLSISFLKERMQESLIGLISKYFSPVNDKHTYDIHS